jgi:hypothetical protein
MDGSIGDRIHHPQSKVSVRDALHQARQVRAQPCKSLLSHYAVVLRRLKRKKEAAEVKKRSDAVLARTPAGVNSSSATFQQHSRPTI